MKITLDNAQSGGPKVNIEDGGETVGYFYPRGLPPEATYWRFPDGPDRPGDEMEFESLAEMPERDGIVLYTDEGVGPGEVRAVDAEVVADGD